MSSAGRSVSPCFQYSVQSLGRDRFRFISPYTTARLDKRQKIFFHTDIVLHSANTSEIQATKKPHNYHKIAVWQKDDRIRKSPLKFYGYYYSILSGDCQASIITELWRLSVVFYVTLWHMIQEKFDTRSFFSARAYWYIRCIVWRISSSVVSGWIGQIRRTVRPFSWVVSTQAKPSSIMRREIVRPAAGV